VTKAGQPIEGIEEQIWKSAIVSREKHRHDTYAIYYRNFSALRTAFTKPATRHFDNRVTRLGAKSLTYTVILHTKSLP